MRVEQVRDTDSALSGRYGQKTLLLIEILDDGREVGTADSPLRPVHCIGGNQKLGRSLPPQPFFKTGRDFEDDIGGVAFDGS